MNRNRSSKSGEKKSPHLQVHHGKDHWRTVSDSSGTKNVQPTQIWKPKSPDIANKSSDLVTSNTASGSENRHFGGNVTQIDNEMLGDLRDFSDNTVISSLKDDEFQSAQASDNKTVNFCKNRRTWKVKSPATASESENALQKANKSSGLVTINRDLDGNVTQFDNEMFGDLLESLDNATISCLKGDEFKSAQASDVVLLEGKMEQSELTAMVKPFDLCLRKVGTSVNLNPSLFATNKAKRNEIQRSTEGVKATVLRPGMILLKSYLSLADQAKIVKKCRDLGLGHGGFYEPCYRNGAKLHLKMMCLGKNWDPETSNYDDHRSTDGAKPPSIPDEFNQLVKKAIQDSQAIIRKEVNTSRVEDILPSMSPDICIVNFYTATGRLGLHKDRDEGQDSLKKGLPVVSFSIGDSADFLYGDENDVCKAKIIDLESGDVLIFGGKSRHIYHGVTAILPKTAPKSLLEETGLCPGRLNLTFRQY